MRKDYKEIWQEFFDEAVEEDGMSEEEAGKYADSATADYYADLADEAHERMREKELL